MTLSITQEAQQLINALCNHALKGVGLEAYAAVKGVEAWLQSASPPAPLAAIPQPNK